MFLVERSIDNRKVEGSTPSLGSTSFCEVIVLLNLWVVRDDSGWFCRSTVWGHSNVNTFSAGRPLWLTVEDYRKSMRISLFSRHSQLFFWVCGWVTKTAKCRQIAPRLKSFGGTVQLRGLLEVTHPRKFSGNSRKTKTRELPPWWSLQIPVETFSDLIWKDSKCLGAWH